MSYEGANVVKAALRSISYRRDTKPAFSAILQFLPKGKRPVVNVSTSS